MNRAASWEASVYLTPSQGLEVAPGSSVVLRFTVGCDIFRLVKLVVESMLFQTRDLNGAADCVVVEELVLGNAIVEGLDLPIPLWRLHQNTTFRYPTFARGEKTYLSVANRTDAAVRLVVRAEGRALT